MYSSDGCPIWTLRPLKSRSIIDANQANKWSKILGVQVTTLNCVTILSTLIFS